MPERPETWSLDLGHYSQRKLRRLKSIVQHFYCFFKLLLLTAERVCHSEKEALRL